MSIYSAPDWNLIQGEKKVSRPELNKVEKKLLNNYTVVWELDIDMKLAKVSKKAKNDEVIYEDSDSFKRLKNMIVASLGVVYLFKNEKFYLFFLEKVIGSSSPEAYFTEIWSVEETVQQAPTNILNVFTSPERDGSRWRFLLDESYMKSSGVDAQIISDFLRLLDLPATYDRPYVTVSLKAKTAEDALDVLSSKYEKIKDDFKPRKLLPHEIDYILDFLGPADVSHPVPCAVKDIGIQMKAELRKFLVSELQQDEYSPLVINATARNLKLSYERSLIPPGATVGLTAAEALGGPVTQMALNSFHAPTSAKSTSTGVDAIKEIFNVTKNRKFKTSTIYFKNQNLSFDEVIKMRIPIVEVNVNTVIYPDKTVIDRLENLGGEEWWHKSYLESTDSMRYIEDDRWVMRLYVNPEILYAYDLTNYEVAEAINRYNITKDAIKAIPSPMLWTDDAGQGPVIDIIPNGDVFDTYITKYMKERGVKGEEHLVVNDYNLDLNFLNSVLLNNFKSNVIQGIKGIEQLFPTSVNVWDVVKGEKALGDFPSLKDYYDLSKKETSKLNRDWMLQLDIYMMIEKGISHKKVSLLCEACGLEVLEINKESLKVKMPEIDKTMLQSYEKDAKDKNKNDLRKPRTYVSFLIEEDSRIKLQDEEKIRLESTDNETRLYMKPKSKIEIASKLMYAETNGSNTAEVSKLPFIDTRRTYSNDFYEIYRLYGVEAIRQYLIRDLDSVIKEGRGFVLMKHIGLLMDYMTNLGTPLAISYTGMSMQGKGTLASASYERPMEIFLRGAGKGRTENINSVSASIFTGKTAKIGTGFMEVLDDTATASELDKYMDNSSNVFSTIEDLTNVSEKELYEWDFEKEDDNEEDK